MCKGNIDISIVETLHTIAGNLVTGPPQMLSVMAANSTSLLISWMAPVLEEQEGILESYSLSCSLAENEDKSSLISETVELFVTVHNLQPYTAYICCLFATTSVGVSGTVCQTQNTPEDSKSASV